MNFADEEIKNITDDRRDSLSFRNAEDKCQHDFKAEVNADECHKVHESYELKWAGERNADNYWKKVAKERRNNLDALFAKYKGIWPLQKSLQRKSSLMQISKKG